MCARESWRTSFSERVVFDRKGPEPHAMITRWRARASDFPREGPDRPQTYNRAQMCRSLWISALPVSGVEALREAAVGVVLPVVASVGEDDPGVIDPVDVAIPVEVEIRPIGRRGDAGSLRRL